MPASCPQPSMHVDARPVGILSAPGRAPILFPPLPPGNIPATRWFRHHGHPSRPTSTQCERIRMNSLFKWFAQPPVNGPRAALLLRLMAGGVFLWEGILKFVYVNQGVGRFTKLGFPEPGL